MMRESGNDEVVEVQLSVSHNEVTVSVTILKSLFLTAEGCLNDHEKTGDDGKEVESIWFCTVSSDSRGPAQSKLSVAWQRKEQTPLWVTRNCTGSCLKSPD